MTTLEKCKECNDVILDSEYELDGPGHSCKKMNLMEVPEICVKCSTCAFFTVVERDFGYCKMLPDGKNEVSKSYNYCKFNKQKEGGK